MNLSLTKHYGVILLFSIAILTSCKKEDSDPGPSDNSQTTDPTSGGTVTSNVNGESFSATSKFCRFRTTGKFAFHASNDDHQQITIVIDNFIGPATYQLASGSSNQALYINSINGQTNIFNSSNGGVGTINITSYDQSNRLVSGNFSFTAVGPSSTSVEVSDGTFEDVTIVSAPEPEAGTASYYLNDFLFESENTQVRISSHFKWEFGFQTAGISNIVYRTGFEEEDFTEPSGISGGRIYYGSFADSELEIDITEVNDSEGYISGTIKSEERDLEIVLNKVPFTRPAEVDAGTIRLTTPNGDVIFDDALLTYEFVPHQTNYWELEASNTNNAYISLKATDPWYDVGNPAAWNNHVWGYSAYLEYYEHEDDAFPSEVVYGDFDRSASSANHITFGFETENLEYQLRANDVDYLYIQ